MIIVHKLEKYLMFDSVVEHKIKTNTDTRSAQIVEYRSKDSIFRIFYVFRLKIRSNDDLKAS